MWLNFLCVVTKWATRAQCCWSFAVRASQEINLKLDLLNDGIFAGTCLGLSYAEYYSYYTNWHDYMFCVLLTVGINLFHCECMCGRMRSQVILNTKQLHAFRMKSYQIFPSASHPCEPFSKVREPTFLSLLLSPTPTPQLTLADHPHVCALYKNSWLRVQVQVNQTPDSSAIKNCCETDSPADRQPRSISWAAYPGTTSCSTPPLWLINISSHLTQIGGSCHRRTLPCNYSVPALVNAALNHPPWQLASGAPGWLQTSSEETTFSSKSRESASTAKVLCCRLATYTLDCQRGFLCSTNDHWQTGCWHVLYENTFDSKLVLFF